MVDRTKSKALEPLEQAPAEIQEIVKRVLKLEHEKLHDGRPRVNSDIIAIIKEVIQ